MGYFLSRWDFPNIVSLLYSTRDDEKSSSSAFNISISFFPSSFHFHIIAFFMFTQKMRHSLSLIATVVVAVGCWSFCCCLLSIESLIHIIHTMIAPFKCSWLSVALFICLHLLIFHQSDWIPFINGWLKTMEFDLKRCWKARQAHKKTNNALISIVPSFSTIAKTTTKSESTMDKLSSRKRWVESNKSTIQ